MSFVSSDILVLGSDITVLIYSLSKNAISSQF